jgi:hypothetical protein
MQEKTILPNIGNKGTIIFGCIVGSHAYGTNVEGSDVDKKWIYVQNHIDLFINGYRPEITISKDEVIFELSRFIELLQKANPTVLELLYSPQDCILYKHASFDKLLSLKKSFLTKACKYSFGGYAVSQIEKAKGLDKKMNWEKERTERKSVLDFCYWISDAVDPKLGAKFQSHPIGKHFPLRQIAVMGLSAIPHTRDLYNLFWDARFKFKGVVQDEDTSNDVSLSDVPLDTNCIGMLYFNKDAYQIHCKEYRQYQTWLSERNTQRYVDIANHGQQIDGKNMLHCLRLIDVALDIAQFGELLVRRPNADYLREIRLGKHDLDTILNQARSRISEMDAAFQNTNLPDKFKEEGLVKLTNFQIRQQIDFEFRAKNKKNENENVHY